jgi:zinc transport system substrate-binding protein
VPLAPLAGIVDAVAPPGGVEVVVLIPPGASPHSYEPSLAELRRAARASAYFGLGLPEFVFERTWLEGLLEGSDAERTMLFSNCRSGTEPGEGDYHAWLSARCLDVAADRIAASLARLLPDAAGEIEENLAAFHRRVAATDSTTRRRLSPLRGRSYLVLHPAWGFLTRPYDMTQMSILSHGSGDPGPARLAALIDRARAAEIRLVLVQPEFNQAPARLVAEELGAGLVSLDPLARDPLEAIDGATAALQRALGEEMTDAS